VYIGRSSMKTSPSQIYNPHPFPLRFWFSRFVLASKC
jgi:hypothetical protein